MGKRWRFCPHDQVRISQFERSGLPAVIAQLLISRGVHDVTAAQSFLEAKLTGLRDPETLPGVVDAADRIYAAIVAGRRIFVYGDYDADGMTSTAILYGCLKLLGAQVNYYIPCRLEEGYSLNDEALRKLAERGASMVITVDCGIASANEADTACEVGIELIVTDHHEMGERLPTAAAIVHPRLPGTSYPFGHLCGAGVAFKLAWALCQRASQAKRVSPHMRQFLLSAVGLAAIGTVADVVPLIDENRIIVRHGLTSLRSDPVLGVRALMKLTGLDQRPLLTSEDIAFCLAPRLNAAGRLGQAALGVELLVTDSEDRAQSLAEYIHQLNTSRDSLEQSIYLAAKKQVNEQFDPQNDPALVLAAPGWHPGVIGIVAGRLAERYHRPVVLIALDELGVKPGCGSARSACGLNLHQALSACTEHLLSHGGHAAAAGLRIAADRVDAFRAQFCEYAASIISPEERIAEVRIDAEAPLAQMTLRTVEQIERLAPFGAGNPRPILSAGDIRLAAPPKRMGGGDRHLCVEISQHNVTFRAVGFGRGEWADELAQHQGPLEIAYRPVINEFRGRRTVEMHLVDWRRPDA